MALPIISADQRLSEKRCAKVALVGVPGAGKTSQIRTLNAASTLLVDTEAGDLSILDWAGDTLRPQDLPAELHGGPFPATPHTPASPERQALLDALVRHRWQPSPAAQALGISRATLYRRVKQHGIDMPRAKRPAPPR